jgi:hypothetical protein
VVGMRKPIHNQADPDAATSEPRSSVGAHK